MGGSLPLEHARSALGYPAGLTDTPSLLSGLTRDRTSAEVSCLTNPTPFFAGVGNAKPQNPGLSCCLSRELEGWGPKGEAR